MTSRQFCTNECCYKCNTSKRPVPLSSKSRLLQASCSLRLGRGGPLDQWLRYQTTNGPTNMHYEIQSLHHHHPLMFSCVIPHRMGSFHSLNAAYDRDVISPRCFAIKTPWYLIFGLRIPLKLLWCESVAQPLARSTLRESRRRVDTRYSRPWECVWRLALWSVIWKSKAWQLVTDSGTIAWLCSGCRHDPSNLQIFEQIDREDFLCALFTGHGVE